MIGRLLFNSIVPRSVCVVAQLFQSEEGVRGLCGLCGLCGLYDVCGLCGLCGLYDVCGLCGLCGLYDVRGLCGLCGLYDVCGLCGLYVRGYGSASWTGYCCYSICICTIYAVCGHICRIIKYYCVSVSYYIISKQTSSVWFFISLISSFPFPSVHSSTPTHHLEGATLPVSRRCHPPCL